MTALVFDWIAEREKRNLQPVAVPKEVPVIDPGWDEPDPHDIPVMDRGIYWGPEYVQGPLTRFFGRQSDPGG